MAEIHRSLRGQYFNTDQRKNASTKLNRTIRSEIMNNPTPRKSSSQVQRIKHWTDYTAIIQLNLTEL